ncbi:MAG: hypothetical protein B6U88_02940 [Candidatus Aenigmarchaeota archaeon ex4484_56]|nr:MAG: hypothetical protein B6U88_02940 [Candidatus Aenigmarchaeota archaeon ex4484_56]
MKGLSIDKETIIAILVIIIVFIVVLFVLFKTFKPGPIFEERNLSYECNRWLVNECQDEITETTYPALYAKYMNNIEQARVYCSCPE